MKIIFSILTACFLSTNCFGQSKNLFYASLEDYIKAKPIPGYEIEKDSFYNGTFGTGFKIIAEGESTKVPLSKIPSEFFTYASTYTMVQYTECFMRSYKGDVYVVLASGPICLYSFFKFPDRQYYSETINGELKRYDRNVIEKYCKQYGLLESYKNDRPKVKASTTAEERINNSIQYDIKFLNIINSKIKP